MAFIGAGLRDEPNSAEVQSDPLISSLSNSASALPTSFDVEVEVETGDGLGSIFLDPFGHEYDSEIEGSLQFTNYSFQLATDLLEDEASPQVYMGDMSATDFHMKFNLAAAINDNLLEFTHFDSIAGNISWNAMVSNDRTEIWFLAPDGVSLDAGELFNIEVDGLGFGVNIVPGDLVITATWSPIPEPTSAVAFASGALVVLAAIRRRRA